MSESVGAIIVAAGSSSRMGGVNKVFAPLGGVEVIARALQVFEDSRVVSRIVLVLGADRVMEGRPLAAKLGLTKVTKVVPGGRRRQDSVRAGLEALGECDYVLVHDGPRPFVTEGIIERVLEGARETGAAVPALPVSDTIKEAGDERLVAQTLDRARLVAVQTPQAFRYDLLARAHREVTADVTDDASMVEALGGPVRIVEGDRRNIKITTPEDLALAEALLAAELA
jgi:2-C-methyl-D-erythritol 4-phosphate cytidylyltransferase